MDPAEEWLACELATELAELVRARLIGPVSELDRAEMARQKIKLLKMKPGDTVEIYTTAFEALANHTGYNETALIEQYQYVDIDSYMLSRKSHW